VNYARSCVKVEESFIRERHKPTTQHCAQELDEIEACHTLLTAEDLKLCIKKAVKKIIEKNLYPQYIMSFRSACFLL